jgi:hypothetical protein
VCSDRASEKRVSNYVLLEGLRSSSKSLIFLLACLKRVLIKEFRVFFATFISDPKFKVSCCPEASTSIPLALSSLCRSMALLYTVKTILTSWRSP